jgi:hypothetical protein
LPKLAPGESPLTQVDERRSRRELARAFSAHRGELADALCLAVRKRDQSAGFLRELFGEILEWWQAVIETAIDLEGDWERAADAPWEDRFAGWITRLNHPSVRPEDAGVADGGGFGDRLCCHGAARLRGLSLEGV